MKEIETIIKDTETIIKDIETIIKERETIIKDIETTREELKTLDRKMLIATVIFSLVFVITTLQIVNLIDLNRQYVETLLEESNKRGGEINEIISK